MRTLNNYNKHIVSHIIFKYYCNASYLVRLLINNHVGNDKIRVDIGQYNMYMYYIL